MALHAKCLRLITVTTCRSHYCRRHASYDASSGFVTYLPGTLNLILTAPHGGYLTPPWIPDRGEGWWNGEKWVYGQQMPNTQVKRIKVRKDPEKYTEEMALLLRDEVHNITGHYPHLILCRLTRAKLDVNRGQDEGTFGNPTAVQAWEEYHACVQTAKQTIAGPGLLLDLHGHRHEVQRTELGYLIKSQQLDTGQFDTSSCSIRRLSERSHSTLSELITGQESFGAYLENEGFDSVPSPSCPTTRGNVYLHGGFTTRRHGSRDGGMVDAIQIESPLTFRRFGTMDVYMRALANVSAQYLSVHYKDALPSVKKEKVLE